jgi:hypothetical protein
MGMRWKFLAHRGIFSKSCPAFKLHISTCEDLSSLIFYSIDSASLLSIYASKLLSGFTRRRQTNPADLIKYIASGLALEPEIWLRSIDLRYSIRANLQINRVS